MKTNYRITGTDVDVGVLGGAYMLGPLASAGSMSQRTPNPVIMATMSANTGSVSIDALSIMNLYYGSGVFSSGYVYIPLFATPWGSTNIGGSTFPVFGLQVIPSIASYARSVGGASGSIGMGIWNSGSTARFGVFGNSAGAVPTFASAANVLVTFLLASSPQLNETL